MYAWDIVAGVSWSLELSTFLCRAQAPNLMRLLREEGAVFAKFEVGVWSWGSFCMLIHGDMFHLPQQQGFKIGAVPASQGLNPQAGRFFLGGICSHFVFPSLSRATKNKGQLTHVGNIPMFAAIALQPFLFNSSFENHSFARKCGPKALRGLACVYIYILVSMHIYICIYA